MAEKYSHPLGIRISQMRLLEDCMQAYARVPNGHFLPSIRWHKAGMELVARGYLTLVDTLQPTGWRVFKITTSNIATYNVDLRIAQNGEEAASNG